MTKPRSGLWAVVPVKLFAESKQRLATLLDRDQRIALVRAMLEDVLAGLTQSPALAGVLVITGDGEAAAIARAMGALVIADDENAGTSAAATRAARHLAASGSPGMLVVPADVPLITPADVDTIVAVHRNAPAVTLVPASMDGGTNALACSPPDALPLCFGEESYTRHRDAALAHGIEPQTVRLPRIGRDIDRPEDVADFLLHPSPTRTYACLSLQAAKGAIASQCLQHVAGIGAPFVSS
jgi:2-phospho-L-lactate guanylyltransferase